MRATAVRRRAIRGATRRRAGSSLTALVLMVGAAGCTDDSGEPPPPDDPDHVALELSMGPGASKLSTQARDRLQNDVSDLLSTYVVDAFLGDYPRDDFVDALGTFTTGEAARAAEDLDLLTGAGFGDDAEDVAATRLSATISSFAPEGHVVGVTAIVDFAFDVETGGATSEMTRSGRLMLMPQDGEWKIFGYQLTPQPGGGS
jgi:hypothetical protein